MNRLNYLLTTSLFASALLMGCTNDTTIIDAPARQINISAVIFRNDNTDELTRAVLNEENGSLSCTWEEGDNVLVTDNAGNKLGVMTLISGAGTATATFDGTLTTNLSGNHSFNFFYIGRKSTDELLTLPNPVKFDFSNQKGTLESLSETDFFSSTTLVSVEDGTAYTENMNLYRKCAFAHFELMFPENVDYNNETISISGSGLYNTASLSMTNGITFSSEGDNTISVTGKDFYITILPNDGEQIAPVFTVAINGKTYKGSLTPRTWKPSEFVRKDHAIGIPVIMTEETPETPADDGTVGPTIELDGKKYRFLRGNLYYDTTEKVWKVFEKQTYFLSKYGETTDYSKTAPAEIDLFAWGATGLENAKDPSYIRRGWASENSFSGANWPSSNTNTMDVNGNANIIDLWKTYGYDNPVYDFGYAYMINGRPDGDTRTFRTPPLEAFAFICNQDYSFSQGCTVKGAGIDGMDVKGALIIPGVTSVEEAKAKIQEVGGSAPKLTKLNVTVNNTGFDFQITLPDYESIEKLNAFFFPLAGSAGLRSGKTQHSTDCGNYWSSDAAKGSSTDANAYGFFFRKSSSASEFHWVVGRNGVSITRCWKHSVRLLVEVTE